MSVIFVSCEAASKSFWLLQEQAKNSLKMLCAIIYTVCGKSITKTNLKNVLEGKKHTFSAIYY